MLMFTWLSFVACANADVTRKNLQLEFTSGNSTTEGETKTVFNVTLDSCLHNEHGDGYAIHCTNGGLLALFRYMGTENGCAPHRLAALYPAPGQPLVFRDRLELVKVFNLPSILSDEDMQMNEVKVAIQNTTDVCGASAAGNSSTVKLQFTPCNESNSAKTVVEAVLGQCYHARGHSVMVTCGNTAELQLVSFKNQECTGKALHNIEQDVCQATTLSGRLPYSVLRAFKVEFKNTHVLSSKALSLSYTITSDDAYICGGVAEKWKTSITENPDATYKVLFIVITVIITPIIFLIGVLVCIIRLCLRRRNAKKRKSSASESEMDSSVARNSANNSCTVTKDCAASERNTMLDGARSERLTQISQRSKCQNTV